MKFSQVVGQGATDFDILEHIVKYENAMVAGDVVQWSDTADSDFPLGIAVEDSVAGDGRVAGVITGTGAASTYGLCQVYGYNTNITTDGSVAAADTYLGAGAAVAVGFTATEMEVFITDATVDYDALRDVFAWNVSVDVGTVGQGFIKTMGM